MKKLFKKGNILDIHLAGIIIFIALIVIVIAFMILSKINVSLEDSGEFSNESLDIIQHQVDIFPNIWDTGWLFILVGLGIYTWISAFFVRSHPVFFIFGFFLIVVYIIVFGVMSNVYGDITENPEISPYSDEFTLANFVMTRFPIIMGIISFVTAIIMYSKGEPRF